MTSDPEETSVTIQEVDRESIKYMKTERDDPSWAAQEGRLLIPASNLDLKPMDVDGYFCPGSGGRTYPH